LAHSSSVSITRMSRSARFDLGQRADYKMLPQISFFINTRMSDDGFVNAFGDTRFVMGKLDCEGLYKL